MELGSAWPEEPEGSLCRGSGSGGLPVGGLPAWVRQARPGRRLLVTGSGCWLSEPGALPSSPHLPDASLAGLGDTCSSSPERGAGPVVQRAPRSQPPHAAQKGPVSCHRIPQSSPECHEKWPHSGLGGPRGWGAAVGAAGGPEGALPPPRELSRHCHGYLWLPV